MPATGSDAKTWTQRFERLAKLAESGRLVEKIADASLVLDDVKKLFTALRDHYGIVDEPSSYEGREIVLGPRAGDYYLVRSGVAEGELVVSHGNFKIDSALQIQAKPSMMTPGDPLEGIRGKKSRKSSSERSETTVQPVPSVGRRTSFASMEQVGLRNRNSPPPTPQRMTRSQVRCPSTAVGSFWDLLVTTARRVATAARRMSFALTARIGFKRRSSPPTTLRRMTVSALSLQLTATQLP